MRKIRSAILCSTYENPGQPDGAASRGFAAANLEKSPDRDGPMVDKVKVDVDAGFLFDLHDKFSERDGTHCQTGIEQGIVFQDCVGLAV
jgi:hypothetical protein